MAAYLAAALPPRPRRLTIDTSVTTIAVSEVSVHPVQITYRVAAALDPNGTILRASMRANDDGMIAIGQRARAFSLNARTVMQQARISSVRRDGERVLIEATLATTQAPVGRDLVLEIVVDRGSFLAVPNEAVVEDGARRLVYLQIGASDYVPREIETGVEGERYTQVVSGIAAGDQVVTLGSFFVDAEYRMKGGS